MVKHLQGTAESLYGFPQPVANQFPTPIPARRDPSTSDTGYIIGQVWINKLAGTAWALVSNSGGVATWLSIGGTLTPTVANITATNFITAAVTTGTTLNSNIWSGTGTNAAINLVMTPKGTGNVTVTSGAVSLTNGNLLLNTVGNGIQIKEGANARMGTTAVMTAGTITVVNTSVTANTVIFLSLATAGGTTGALSSVPTAGVGFVINSSSATDTSTVNYLLIEAL
jgi:hypothetical protein